MNFSIMDNETPEYQCGLCLQLKLSDPNKSYVPKYPLFHFCDQCSAEKVADKVKDALSIVVGLDVPVIVLPFAPSILDCDDSHIFPDETCICLISAVVEVISSRFAQHDEVIQKAYHQIIALFASKFDECADDESATSDLLKNIFIFFVSCVLQTAYDTYKQ